MRECKLCKKQIEDDILFIPQFLTPMIISKENNIVTAFRTNCYHRSCYTDSYYKKMKKFREEDFIARSINVGLILPPQESMLGILAITILIGPLILAGGIILSLNIIDGIATPLQIISMPLALVIGALMVLEDSIIARAMLLNIIQAKG